MKAPVLKSTHAPSAVSLNLFNLCGLSLQTQTEELQNFVSVLLECLSLCSGAYIETLGLIRNASDAIPFIP